MGQRAMRFSSMDHDLAQPVPFPPSDRPQLSRLTDDAEARAYPLFRQQSLCSNAANLFVRRENKSNWSRFVGNFQRCS